MDYKLSDLIDVEKSRSLLESFCEAVGIASAIIDLEGDVLIGVRWQKICTDFHRVNQSTFIISYTYGHIVKIHNISSIKCIHDLSLDISVLTVCL